MKKITIIEDDIDIRNMITKFLINHNYEVSSAPNGKEGIELCQRMMPDLIIMDLMLPVLSGDNVIKQLRTFTDIPVIVVSAKTMVQSKIELLHLGADDYGSDIIGLNQKEPNSKGDAEFSPVLILS